MNRYDVRAGPAKVLPNRVGCPRPAQYYVFGRVFFTRCWSCTNPRMESKPFFPFVREMRPIQRSGKIPKRPYLVWKKRARFPFVCIFRANTRLNFQVETRKFGRRIAVKQQMIVITCVMYGNRVLAISLDGWRILALILLIVSVFS